jgi:hypothetical protein
MAAAWLATSPVALVESMQVMSDVPVTAAWLLCWWLAARDRPVAAGGAAALAILIRPNLAPLAVLPALLLVWHSSPPRGAASHQGGRGLASAFTFFVPVALAAAAVAYVQWRWFGSPLRSGYGTAGEIYSLANVGPNLRLYGQWLVDTHITLVVLALAALLPLLVSPFNGRQGTEPPRHALFWMGAFAAGVVASYLLYAQFEVWTYLRFLLPALAATAIIAAVGTARLVDAVPPAGRIVVLIATVSGLAATNIAAARGHDVFRFAERHARGRAVGEALAVTLPVNAVIVSGEQSGAMRYYTGRSILRWDLMDDGTMREALDWLTLNGYQVWVVLDDWEEEPFRRRVPTLAAMALDYEPTVESAAGVGIRTRAWRARRLTATSSNKE